ncbi:MAG: heme lyase CcmF/NrfE family subunit [Anaerolineaceae bacterium]|jgi:cytochrome c-type biogenesis protein CcmF|nr:heme lyase CcmF/NrfE family subunit [Anaerolineaceae bacterium]
MLPNLGYGSLVITLIVVIYAIVSAAIGERKNLYKYVESARLALLLTFPLLTITVISIVILLINQNYEVQYVYNVTSSTMPLYLKVTALWGGQAGSLVFWAWLMSAFGSAVTLRKWDRDLDLLPWVIIISSVTLLFFLIMIIAFENPFVRFWSLPSGGELVAMFGPRGSQLINPFDGRGLNPLLRHPGMVIHPPMLYLGFVSFVIPFAFGMAALITGRKDDRWIRLTRRWTLVAWMFLSIGLILGSRWAYDVLGWGGYWAWDPVENAAFMPWLSGTAFLHSVMIQEKRGLFKRWNMILVILTYSLVIFGTFLTRSGVLSSVHAFAQSAIGPMFFIYIGASFIISLAFLIKRWDELRSDGEMTSLLSRESLFLVNNLLFMGILVVVFWGTVYPLISELFTGQKVTVGPPFYTSTTGPLFAGLLLLMGIAPLSAWGHSTWKTLGKALWIPATGSLILLVVMIISGISSVGALIGITLASLAAFVTIYEFWRGMKARHKRSGENYLEALWKLTTRNRRRYGGYIIHLSVVFMAIGIIGIELFQTETQGRLAPGESTTLAGYTVTFQNLAQFDVADGRNVARAVLTVSKNGRDLGELYPRRDFYYDSQQPMTIPGVRSTIEDDLYIILVNWEQISSLGATFKVFHNPLINWLWFGGILLVIGSFIAAWPDPEKEIELAPSRIMRREPGKLGSKP